MGLKLKCKICGNETEGFYAVGTHRYDISDYISNDGKITDYD